MTISELIKRLEDEREKRGDLKIYHQGDVKDYPLTKVWYSDDTKDILYLI